MKYLNWMLFICIFFASQNVLADCSEMDGGEAADKPGYVIVNGKYIFDGCGTLGTPSQNTLTERYCDGNVAKYKELDCKALYNQDCFKSGQSASCGDKYFADWDGDGVMNKVDNCPNIPNPDQKDSDKDKDIDKLGDACDDAIKANFCDDGDYDGDKFSDKCDNCPTVANPDQADNNKNGVGDVCEVECSSNDYDESPYDAGLKDTCATAATMLQEVVCKNGKLEVISIDCNTLGGMICKGGKCVKPEGTEPPPDENPEDKPEYEANHVPPGYDGDGDGVPFEEDNCNGTANPDQADSDGDGIGDECTQANPGNDPEGGSGGGGGGDCDSETTTVHLDSISTLDLYAVAGSASWQWVGGEGGNVVKRFGNKAWENMPNPWDSVNIKPSPDLGRTITSMWSPDGTNLYAVTLSGHLFHWNGSKWVQWGPTGLNDGKSFGGAIYSVHGTNNSDLWLAGANGMIWHYYRGAWMDDKIITSTVFGAARGSDKKQYDKTTWRAIFAVPTGPVWFVGDGGMVAKRPVPKAGQGFTPGIGWQTAKLPFIADLRAVWADKNKAYTGGINSGILCAASSGFQFKNCAGELGGITILGISGTSEADIVAVGPKSRFSKKDGANWLNPVAPVPNTITSVWSNGTTTIAAGINGAVYTFEDGLIKTTYLTRKQISHPEWTDTRWTALQGNLHKKDIEYLWVAGDDLSVALYNDGVWQLVYSDDDIIPFVVPKGMAVLSGGQTNRVLHDLYEAKDGSLYAVGNIDYVLQRSAGGTWSNIQLPSSGQTPDMRSAGEGLEDNSVIVAGNLGLFKISGGIVEPLFEKSDPNVAVANRHKDAIWMAKDLGAYILDDKDKWSDISYGAIKLSPVDINDVGSQVVVAGDEIVEAGSGSGTTSWLGKLKNLVFGSSGVIGVSAPKSHYLVSNGGAWKDVELPPGTGRILGLHPFSETIEIPYKDDIKMKGMVVMGEKGFLAGRLDGMWVPIDTESTEDWYDGTYYFLPGYDVDYDDIESWWDLYVVGVGGHNDVTHTHVYEFCD